MDARASIISNNLNVRIKTLTILTIGIMLPTLVVSVFSMNVKLPIEQELSHLSFWAILLLAAISSVAVAILWRKKRW
jgi:magnesium transporter